MTVREAVERVLPGVLDDLKRLVAVESVSADPARADQVLASAELAAGLIRDAGAATVEIATEASQPAVIASFPAPPGAPTVCLYAHHDVQPEGDAAQWTTPPFQATERDGRLYGRGTADDKGGLAVHLAALRAFDGRPPVGVKLFIEGEEEIGSPGLGKLLSAHREALVADAFVIADSGNWEAGRPALTTTLRGLADCVVEVRTLDHAIHSGSFGGVAPDALTALCRLLATLHDDQGNVAVPGLVSGAGPDLDYPEERFRAESGMLDSVRTLGEGSVGQRLWEKAAIAVIALDATPVAKASNTLHATARAKISMRLAPGDDAPRALRNLTEHLTANAPWGAQVTVTPGDLGGPSRIPFEGPIAAALGGAITEAWGVEPVLVGQGGSIPMAAEFAIAYPEAAIFLTAVGDPQCRAHGIDESLHLGDFRAACLAEALFLERLATA
ncbi:dipeptidase [Microlunatus parietis]|uniref:Acetylornithine deacetylase/succinyl-diaminopimelate desuccinylase-like protein n=1 Tax=Microlunatus parietis TaxID=682979 RepID=A0A7Y9LAH4_9ACTN|nr:dipeptidase [Microlunatus parietis]NYE72854.1 acetylornithine deacetylase/succinyl-diaminopimelate desuccinylase-like protein [Microlunatus parietis]